MRKRGENMYYGDAEEALECVMRENYEEDVDEEEDEETNQTS